MRCRRVLHLLALIATACGSFAGAEQGMSLGRTEINDLFSQAKDFFRRANEAAVRDPAAAKELYQKAIMRFELIASRGGIRNGKLHYNIGNAYFRMGDLGRAILHYRRAERLIPNDPNLRQNLDNARRQRIDKIEVKERTRVLKTLFFWHYDSPTSTRLHLFAAFFALLWVCAAVRLFIRKALLGWGTVVSAVVAVLLFGSLLAEEVNARSRTEGVLLATEVVARKGDSETYQPSFQEPLHAGTEFDLVEERRDWLHIALADGRECWVPAKTAGLVQDIPR